DMISVTGGSQIILICKNYNCIKFDHTDTIRLNSLESQCAIVKASFTTAYFHYIWEELFGSKPDQQTYLHNIGAVRRSRGQGANPTLWVDTINYLTGDLKIKWGDNNDQVSLKVFGSPFGGKALLSMNIISNNFDLSSLIIKLKPPGVYYWSVPDQPKRYYLKLWQPQEYKQATDFIIKTVLQTGKAETAYMSGFLLEKNYFLAEAIKYYQIAYKLEPQNKIYQKAYARFL
ncbi:MAG: hypothetical protein ACHQHN_14705, partial [Sphingobacteriales bacterium]